MKSSGGAIRVALIGVATIMLGGCSETGQFGNNFGAPIASSAPRVDRTPTGSVTAAQPSQGAPFTDFFKEAFRPFDDKASEPAPRPARAARPPVPVADRPIPVAPIASAPLAPPTAAPAVKPSYALRSAPNSVGGWTSEGGTPVVVAQGESADMIAQRFGVPTDTLLSLNGFASRAQVQPGARLTIPVYHANAARSAAVAPVAAPAVKAASVPHLAAKSLVGEEIGQTRRSGANRVAQTLAVPKADASALLAEKNARQAQARAEQAKALAQAEAAKHSNTQAAADAARKAAEAKTAAAKAAAAAQVAQAKAAAPGLPTNSFSAATAAAAPAKAEANKQAKVQAPVDSDATASLQPSATAAAGAGDSANPEFRWPARGRVIQGFGNSGNDGINIAVPEGTQVKAAESGVVAYAGSELKGYGNLVLIRHPNGFVTAYANNGALNVKRGETVKRGQTIALSGQSGNVSSPQLHFELRKGSKPVDPSAYLAGL